MEEQKHAGAGWLRTHLKYKGKENISPLGEKVADLLGDVFVGIYHLDGQLLLKTNWQDEYCLEVEIGQMLSTYDNPTLTWLVVLAHDRMLRVGITSRYRGRLILTFHQRAKRDGSLSERMPSMEQHLQYIRRYHPTPEI